MRSIKQRKCIQIRYILSCKEYSYLNSTFLKNDRASDNIPSTGKIYTIISLTSLTLNHFVISELTVLYLTLYWTKLNLTQLNCTKQKMYCTINLWTPGGFYRCAHNFCIFAPPPPPDFFFATCPTFLETLDPPRCFHQPVQWPHCHLLQLSPSHSRHSAKEIYEN